MKQEKTLLHDVTAKGLLAYTASLPKIWLIILVSSLHHLITVITPFIIIFMMSQLWFINNPVTYLQLAVGFMIIGSLWIFTSFMKDQLLYKLLLEYSTKLSTEAINLLINLPYSYLANLPVESQFMRTTPLENLAYVWLNGIVKPLLDLPLIILAFSSICYMLGFTYFSYIIVILTIVVILSNYKNKISKQSSELSEPEYQGTIKDTLNNISLIKSHNRTDFFLNKNLEMVKQKYTHNYIADTKKEVIANIAETLLLFIYIGSLTFSVYYTLAGYLEIKLLIIILLLTWFSIAPLKTILSAVDEIPKAKNILRQIKSLQQIDQTVNRHKKMSLSDNFNGHVILKNVNLIFTNTSRFSLKNINLEVKKGEVLLLNGPSSSGKSTILKLLASLYKPSSGLIVIHNDINLIDPDSLSERIIYIGNDSYFDNSSIYENIELSTNINSSSEVQNITNNLNIDAAINSNVLNKYIIDDFKDIDSNKISYHSIVNKIILSKLNPNTKGKIILIDDPINISDTTEYLYLAKLIKILKVDNTIIITSKHDLLSPLADHILTIHNGVIVTTGQDNE